MKTGPQPTPRFKMIKLDIIAAFVLLILVIIFSVWYSHHKSKPSLSAPSPTAGWASYASDKYGFQFKYPGSWGTPVVVQYKGEVGNHYSIVFSNPRSSNKRDLNISIDMDSENYQRKICPSGHCSIIFNPTTSKTVQSDLRNHSSAFVSHDDSSYGFMVNGSSNTTLQEQQIVPLSPIKVSAAVATFTINNVKGCLLNKFATSSQPLCIDQNDYDTLNTVLKSIKAA